MLWFRQSGSFNTSKKFLRYSSTSLYTTLILSSSWFKNLRAQFFLINWWIGWPNWEYRIERNFTARLFIPFGPFFSWFFKVVPYYFQWNLSALKIHQIMTQNWCKMLFQPFYNKKPMRRSINFLMSSSPIEIILFSSSMYSKSNTAPDWAFVTYIKYWLDGLFNSRLKWLQHLDSHPLKGLHGSRLSRKYMKAILFYYFCFLYW